jgi:hypothetical protein
MAAVPCSQVMGSSWRDGIEGSHLLSLTPALRGPNVSAMRIIGAGVAEMVILLRFALDRPVQQR